MSESCFMCKQTKSTMAFVKVVNFGEVWACHGCARHIKFELLNREEEADGKLLGRSTLPNQGGDEEASGQYQLPNM